MPSKRKKMRQEKEKKRGGVCRIREIMKYIHFLSFMYFKTLSIGTALEIDPYLLPCSQVLYWLSWKYIFNILMFLILNSHLQDLEQK